MKNTDSFLISYAATVFSTITILSLLRVTDIEVYVALIALEFFIVSELMSPGAQWLSRRRMVVGIVLVVFFVAIMFGRILGVIMQT
jgi:hypothetical protein